MKVLYHISLIVVLLVSNVYCSSARSGIILHTHDFLSFPLARYLLSRKVKMTAKQIYNTNVTGNSQSQCSPLMVLVCISYCVVGFRVCS